MDILFSGLGEFLPVELSTKYWRYWWHTYISCLAKNCNFLVITLFGTSCDIIHIPSGIRTAKTAALQAKALPSELFRLDHPSFMGFEDILVLKM